METPPIKSLTKELTLARAKIPPTHKILFIKLLSEKFIENIISNTIATITCINNNEKKFLAQDLKNQDVEFCDSVKKANGVSNIKTFIIIYLKAYENTKPKSEAVNVPFIIGRITTNTFLS